jgi:hypothetical protein
MKRMRILGMLLSIIILAGVSSANDFILVVDIDIKPGSFPNSINLTSTGLIPVAILTTDDFDATTVDHTTVFFAGASEAHIKSKSGEVKRHEEDIDGDGDIDLIFHFDIQETSLLCIDTVAYVTGQTYGGLPIAGSDSVNLVDCE